MNNREDILKNEERSADGTIVSPPSLDLNRYRPFLPDLGLSGEAGDEFLRELWKLSIMFVHANVDVETIPEIFPEIFDDASSQTPGAVDSNSEDANG